MALVLKTITGTILNLKGEPASGRVIFSSTYRLVDESGHTVYVPVPIIASLTDGEFSAALAAVDSPGITPSGWTWRITEDIDGQPATTWNVQIAHDATEPIDYASLVEVTEPPVVGAYASVDQLNTEATTRATADTALDARLDTAETAITANTSSITAETTFRQNADTALDERIDDLESGSVLKDADNVLTGTLTWDVPDEQTTLTVVNQSATLDPDTSANQHTTNYKGEPAWWLNEWGGPRVRVPSQAVLGYAETGYKIFEQVGGNGDGLQIFAPSDGSTPSVRTRGGYIYAKNLNESAWTPIVINSPQTASKYSSPVDGTNGYNSAQVRIINGGKTAELRGRINVVTTGGVTDEVIATTMPTGITLGNGTASAIPQRVRGFMAMGPGGGLRLNILANGNLVLIGTALTQAYILLDDCTYSLEL